MVLRVSFLYRLNSIGILFNYGINIDQCIHTGVQIQQSWAYANKVNLLAAGTSTRMTTGSGIYSGLKGTVRAIMAVAPTTRVLIAQVPKQPNYLSYIAADQDINKENGQEPSRSSRNIWQEKLDKYYLRALNLDEHLHQSGKICQKGTCCEYNITASIRKEHAGVVGNLKCSCIELRLLFVFPM